MRPQLLLFLIFALLVGCSTAQEKLSSYSTIDEAIAKGLEEEGVSKENILSKENIGDNLFIFYRNKDSLGVATIYTKEKNYTWYKGQPNLEVKNSTNEFPFFEGTIKTQDKKEYQIIVGKALNKEIGKVTVYEDGTPTEVSVDSKSGLYYYIKQKRDGKIEVKNI